MIVVGFSATDGTTGAGDRELRGGSFTAGGVAPFVLGVARHVRGVQQVVWIAINAVGRACLEQQDRASWIFAQTTYRTWISFSSGRLLAAGSSPRRG